MALRNYLGKGVGYVWKFADPQKRSKSSSENGDNDESTMILKTALLNNVMYYEGGASIRSI